MSPRPSSSAGMSSSLATGTITTCTRTFLFLSSVFSASSKSLNASTVSPICVPLSMKYWVFEYVVSTRMRRRSIMPSRSPVHVRMTSACSSSSLSSWASCGSCACGGSALAAGAAAGFVACASVAAAPCCGALLQATTATTTKNKRERPNSTRLIDRLMRICNHSPTCVGGRIRAAIPCDIAPSFSSRRRIRRDSAVVRGLRHAKVPLAAQRCPHRNDELVAGRVLQDIAECPSRDSALHEIGAVVDSHQDDARRWMLPDDGARGGDTVAAGHADVGHHHVRCERRGGREQRVAVVHLADDLELSLEQRAQQGAVRRMVVREQHPRARHRFRSVSGAA